ncbi:MAG: hypothetical protein NC413_01290 [Muribaculum sp.]|nr:hypothetical protein [Muribaculum sp.]
MALLAYIDRNNKRK